MITDDRRIGIDRRRRPTPPLSRYALQGRRRQTRRRSSDPPHYYVDRLGGSIWLVILAILLMQVLDAYLTIARLQGGAVELNPIMRHLLSRSENLFLTVKLTVSVLGLLFLGIHKNYPLARPGLGLLLALFLAVVGWHCYLAYQMT